MTPISILILTRNEEQDIAACLASVAWSDDIHVFDSESTDRTAEIARAAGAHVTTRTFDTYSAQRNAALTTLPFKHDWIFILDADERPTEHLSREMAVAVASSPECVAAYRIRRRDFLWNTWLKHAQLSPFYIRLVRKGRARYVRAVNEAIEVDGSIGQFDAPMDHYPFSKGISHWVTKHNVYSTMEAQLLASGAATADASLRTALFGRDFHRRRTAQKAIFYSLPGRPLIKWLYMMFVRGAILDGAAGTTYATLQSFYEYLIELKRKELLQKQKP
ncbi:MAG TPA: glycosyltransferase family 2 protein [Acidobacteriaceae bacterium]